MYGVYLTARALYRSYWLGEQMEKPAFKDLKRQFTSSQPVSAKELYITRAAEKRYGREELEAANPGCRLRFQSDEEKK
jgi:hypothetical protein